ncbi:CRISPR-associated endonuclease Cas2 [Campylobacter ureolyticus]|uniref:CRISPR-associated endonuclease Cas2 n=1 Tax=Campylobacter ureolyticus TaxID=827 RepID=UPI0022B325B1|nr:CRISPR-associated endonuclease Cas2 [Campylobacter ureolyticus]MCZ6158075.1 CRISPR-associated endonuclease Cas2 [Campylobacter ureolyticus]
MKYLITYDIISNRRRKKIADILEGVGKRVNLSVFECELNDTKLKHLKTKLLKQADPKTDSIRIYRICENCVKKSFGLCMRDEIFVDMDLYI